MSGNREGAGVVRVEVVPSSERLFACPDCDHLGFRVAHLLGTGRRFGPWYCDECGHSFDGVANKDGTVDVSRWKGRKDDTLVLLQRGDVFLVVEGAAYDGEPVGAHDEYYYNEHTCPVNYLGRVVEVIEDGVIDPHGVFRHVATIPHPGPDIDPQTAQEWFAVFDAMATP